MDEQQVEGLYNQYKTGIYRYSLSILKNPAAAEDVLQDTFLRVLNADGCPWSPGKEQAWLYRVARNLCYDHLRKTKRTQAEAEPTDPGGYLWLELTAPLNRQELEIVSLKILGGLTHEEVAHVLKCTTHAAKKRYERAIQKLRRQMKEE